MLPASWPTGLQGRRHPPLVGDSRPPMDGTCPNMAREPVIFGWSGFVFGKLWKILEDFFVSQIHSAEASLLGPSEAAHEVSSFMSAWVLKPPIFVKPWDPLGQVPVKRLGPMAPMASSLARAPEPPGAAMKIAWLICSKKVWYNVSHLTGEHGSDYGWQEHFQHFPHLPRLFLGFLC